MLFVVLLLHRFSNAAETQNFATMKATTLQSRLAKRNNGSKSAQSYRIVSDLINNTNKTFTIRNGIIRPCYTSGRGRFTTNMDHTSGTLYLLDLIGVRYEKGNDAPRGSATGNFIKIITKIEF